MKDPAVLFYTGDFMTGCSCLTMEERGQYITLLCLQHQIGHLNEKTIRLSLGSVSVDVLQKFKKDENGNYYNERMDDEIKKRSQFVDSRKINGAKGGRPITKNKESNIINIKPLGYPSGKPSEKLIENENINENKYKNDFLKNIEKINLNIELHEYYDIAFSFYKLFENNLIEAGAKTKILEKAKGTWIDDIRLLIEKDNYEIDQIRKVYNYLKVNDFWKKNILSLSTLRAKFERLLLEIKNTNNTQYGTKTEESKRNELKASFARIDEIAELRRKADAEREASAQY